MKKYSIFSIIAGILFLFSFGVNAGMYTDDLSRCLVESSTPSDKLALVKWIFTAISLHPSVKSIASVSTEQIDNANKETADIFVKLVTQTCKDQTVKAIKYEGQIAIQSSFGVLGQVAMMELISNPEVAAGMAGLEKYMDAEKIKSALDVNQ